MLVKKVADMSCIHVHDIQATVLTVYCAADFAAYTSTTSHFLPKYEISCHFCCFAVQFASDMAGNPEKQGPVVQNFVSLSHHR